MLAKSSRSVEYPPSKLRLIPSTNSPSTHLHPSLENLYIPCRTSEKLVQLARIIQTEAATRAASHFIVYLSTGACVDYFYRILPRVFPSTSSNPIVPVFHSLHGNLPPAARTRTLHAFSSALATPQAPAVLLATDVAARGLDIPHVDVVVQVEPPTDPKAFSHRCGRTARAGRSGRAYVLLCGREVEYVGTCIHRYNHCIRWLMTL